MGDGTIAFESAKGGGQLLVGKQSVRSIAKEMLVDEDTLRKLFPL